MKRLVCLFISFVFISTAILSVGVSALDFDDKIVLFVSPDGTDYANGTIESPLSLSSAKERLKNYKGTYNSATVYLLGGKYYIDKTIEFNESDMANVSFEAYEGEIVEFSAAKPITGFKKAKVNGVDVFKTEIDTSSEDWYFKSLYKNEKQLSVTRYPESGYFLVNKLCPEDDLWNDETKPWELTLGQQSFFGNTDDIKLNFHNYKDVSVRILHYWHDELMFLNGVNTENGKISLSRPSSMLIREADRYYFENVFEALDKPCEWYLDSVTGELYYVPEKNDSVEDLVLYGSSLTRLVDINGVDGISFKGVRFTQTDWEMPVNSDKSDESSWYSKNNMDFPQAAIYVKGVVNVEYANNIHFINCEFTNIGGSGIKFLNGVKNSSVENCFFKNIAATGIFVGGKNCLPNEADYTENIVLKNNEINKYGRKFYCAIGIHITYCNNAEVVNNEIHDGYYTGISCGWVWGYGYNATDNINISRNLIYNIGQGWLSDMGGIYTLGEQPGTVISENVIHNVAADSGEGGYGGWGIYLDEGSSHMIVEKNLVYLCGSQGINIHYGEGNTIKNNISAFNNEGQISVGNRDEGHSTSYIYNNIFLTKNKAPVYCNMINPQHFSDNNNIMWSSTEGDMLYFDTAEYIIDKNDAESDGYIANTMVFDPLFKNSEKYNFKFSDDSPIYTTNFQTWDYDVAGTEEESVVGLMHHGGRTSYNESAEPQPDIVFEHNGLMYKLLKNTPMIISALAFVILVILLITISKNNTLGYVSLSVLVFAVLSFVLYHSYLEWIQYIYYPAAAVLGITLSAIPYQIRTKIKQIHRRKIIFVVIHIIVSSGVFLGLTGIFNMLFSSGSPIVITLSLVLCLICFFVQLVYCFKSLKKNEF